MIKLKMMNTMIFIYTIILLAIVQPTYQTIYACDSTAACGCSFNPASVSRIVGGEDAGAVTWGWSVSISFDTDGYLCGGSIISDLINIQWSGTQNRIVSEVILHPGFDKDTFANDIALLKLNNSLNMSDPNVDQICMPLVRSTPLASGEWPSVNTTIVAVGWGTLAESGSVPGYLQQVTLQIIDCQAPICLLLPCDNQTKFCASVPGGAKDTCQGDSGSPLMMFSSNNQWILVGLTSAGYGCARENYSGLYIRVAAYEGWIKSHVTNSYWIEMDSHANTISTPIVRLFFSIAPLIYMIIVCQ